jgi:hypothetical protein
LARLAREAANTDTDGGRQADRHLVRLADALEMKAAKPEHGDSHCVRWRARMRQRAMAGRDRR